MSTSKKSIEHLRYTDPAISDVIDWREHQKILTTFCNPVLERIPEGVDLCPVRCSIKTTRVTTRRLAAADPNLLQIPVRHALGRRVRECYIAPEGQLLGAWDLSTVEMRVMGHESQDPLLCRLFSEGRDVHAETASRIFGVRLKDVDLMDHRYPAKRAGFGIIYGISGRALYDQFRMMGIKGWSVVSCDELIAEFLKVYGGVRDFITATTREVKRTGIVRDHWGMIRYLPGAWSDEFKLRAEAGRMAVSHKISGGAQGMIQRSMIWLKPHIRHLQKHSEPCALRWALQVHDEIILQFNAGLWEILNPLVMEALTQRHGWDRIRIPIEAEGHKSRSWGDLK